MAFIGPLLGAGAAAMGGTGGAAGLLGAVGSLASAGVAYAGAQQQAKSQEAIAKYNAQQQEEAARQERAEGQREAERLRKEKEMAASRFRAIAADSGSDLSYGDPAATLGAVLARGYMNEKNRQYSSDERARQMRNAAKGTKFEGKMAAATTKAKGYGDLIGGVFGAFNKMYG